MLRKFSLLFSLPFIFSSSVALANVAEQARAPEHPSVAAEVAPAKEATKDAMGSTAAKSEKLAAPTTEASAKAPQSKADTNLPNAYEMTPKAKAGKVAQPPVADKQAEATQPAQPQPATKAKETANKQAAAGNATDTAGSVDQASVGSAGQASSVDSAAAVQTSVEKASVASIDQAADQTAADLEVVDFVLAGKVESREPQDVVEAFSKENERGFAFARLHAKAPSEVTFVWYRDDKPVARFKQPIQAAKKWRTYSSVKLRPGQWKVQLLSEDKVLAEKTFTIE